VLTEVGTTAHGEALFGFTHRTFLEYFAAACLSSTHDSPEQLARHLAGRIARSEWDTVAQLAVQIKAHASERGADRVYKALLTDHRYRSVRSIGNILSFLGRCAAFAQLAPETIRTLARRDFAHLLTNPASSMYVEPLAWLMVSAPGEMIGHIKSELEARIDALVRTHDREIHLLGLRLALQLGNAPFAISRSADAWNTWDVGQKYSTEITRAAEYADDLAAYLCMGGDVGGILPFRHDLPHFLFRTVDTGFLKIRWWSSARFTLSRLPGLDIARDPVAAYLDSLLSSPSPPPQIIMDENIDQIFYTGSEGISSSLAGTGPASTDTCRLAAYIACVFAENPHAQPELKDDGTDFPALLYPYLRKRWGAPVDTLPALPVDERWRHIFISWAQLSAHFTVQAGTMNSE
jgi:hypothetical protein